MDMCIGMRRDTCVCGHLEWPKAVQACRCACVHGTGAASLQSLRPCIDLCIEVRIDICVEVRIDMCIEVWRDMCIEVCVDMRIEVRIDTCVEVCIDMCTDVRADMREGCGAYSEECSHEPTAR